MLADDDGTALLNKDGEFNKLASKKHGKGNAVKKAGAS